MLDHHVTLGSSGLRVSPFCLGTMALGEDLGWGASVAESERILARYVDLGGNFIDTANLYTRGHAETILGDWMGARRQRLVVGTKFCASMYPGDPNGGGAGRKAIVRACEDSLRRLRTDYIDVYWMHQRDPITPIAETVAALEDLVCSGKVRYLALSDVPAWQGAQAQLLAGRYRFIALQLEYSLLERTVEAEQVPMAREFGMGCTPWSPLKNGVLSGKYRRGVTVEAARGAFVQASLTERAYAIVDELARIAAELDSTVARVALAWLCDRPGVTSPILGVRTVAQLDDNVGALALRLAPAHVAALDDVSRPALPFPAPYSDFAAILQRGGMTIDGHSLPRSPISP